MLQEMLDICTDDLYEYHFHTAKDSLTFTLFI